MQNRNAECTEVRRDHGKSGARLGRGAVRFRPQTSTGSQTLGSFGRRYEPADSRFV